ncbi:hypothetical protein BN1723_020858, partial [Verticillium longisporum]
MASPFLRPRLLTSFVPPPARTTTTSSTAPRRLRRPSSLRLETLSATPLP